MSTIGAIFMLLLGFMLGIFVMSLMAMSKKCDENTGGDDAA